MARSKRSLTSLINDSKERSARRIQRAYKAIKLRKTVKYLADVRRLNSLRRRHQGINQERSVIRNDPLSMFLINGGEPVVPVIGYRPPVCFDVDGEELMLQDYKEMLECIMHASDVILGDDFIREHYRNNSFYSSIISSFILEEKLRNHIEQINKIKNYASMIYGKVLVDLLKEDPVGHDELCTYESIDYESSFRRLRHYINSQDYEVVVEYRQSMPYFLMQFII